MKPLFAIILIFLSYNPINAQEKNTAVTSTVLFETQGDLDKDNIPEKVIVYETHQQTDLGSVRKLVIYKKNASGNWVIWKQSNNAILKSGEGGMAVEEPLQKIEINKGVLVIEHQGGGGPTMWQIIHKYRFHKNTFYLIGVTTQNSEYENTTVFDYNLSTGNAIYSVYGDDVLTKKKQFNHKLKNQPTLKTVAFGKQKIELPNDGITIYF